MEYKFDDFYINTINQLEKIKWMYGNLYLGVKYLNLDFFDIHKDELTSLYKYKCNYSLQYTIKAPPWKKDLSFLIRNY